MMQNRKPALFQDRVRHDDVSRYALPDEAVARLGQGNVWDMAISPSGEYLAVGTPCGLWWYEFSTMSRVALWNLEAGGVARIAAVSFSPDGELIATGGYDGLVKVWDIPRGAPVSKMERWENHNQLLRQNEISRLAFSPDGQMLAVSGRRDYIVDILRPDTGETLAKINSEHQMEVRYCALTRPVAFSPDNLLIACASPDDANPSSEPTEECISVWDVSGSERVAYLTDYRDVLYSLAFSPCGRFLAAGGHRKGKAKLKVWSIGSWQLHRSHPDMGADRIIVSYSTGNVLCAAAVFDGKNTVEVWDVEHTENLYTLKNDGEIGAVHFAKGTQLVADCFHDFRVRTDENPHTRAFAHLHTGFAESLVFSSDEKTLASAHRGGGIRLWDVDVPSKAPRIFHPPGTGHRVYAPASGKIHATSRDENTVNVWEVGINTPLAQITLEKPPSYGAVAYSAKTQRLGCGDDNGTISVWEVPHGERRCTFTAHTTEIVNLVFSPNGKYLVSLANYGPDSRLWDIERGEEIPDFPGNRIEFVGFSPCSALIVGDTEKEILLWDVERCETRLTIPKPESWIHNGLWQMALAFSPCGRYFASAPWWELGMARVPVRLWRAATGEILATFRGHARDVAALAFSPEGSRLASGGCDGTILLWDITPYVESAHGTSLPDILPLTREDEGDAGVRDLGARLGGGRLSRF
ncbi:MAG: WD40 repeat domain-containing protein [Candidatus Poribacteria bacterium]|nr:WD40 repeat domain-containing protein [Candidatus Poribacteria bacterium]